ncbi:MAG: L-threonylcarbamoyladenylate synthase [Myxococcaceae bacterium]
MAAPIVEIDPEHPNPRQLQRALELLEHDGLIAYPTDTYYGIGCDLTSKKGIDRIYELKGRDRQKPLSFICHDLSHVADYALVSNFAYRTMKSLTPGPFTFILQATRYVPNIMQTKQKNVGIRVPESTLARELSKRLGRPLVSTSATDREGNALSDARDIKDALGNQLDLILDGGVQHLEPSTVVSLLNDEIEVLRQGKGVID